MALHQLASGWGKYASKTKVRMWEMISLEWYLGFTSFGGPNVHFQIFQKMFVERLQWLDDQMYKEMFAICQSLSGPGSTKMIYAINLIHSGFSVAILSFFIWSLPGAFAAYGLAVGISHISDSLPAPVYALLSGLNSATVGIIALAAVQLARKSITDKLTRILVFFGGTAGMLYNALWYFPVLMVAGGLATIIWDTKWLQQTARSGNKLIFKHRWKASTSEEAGLDDSAHMQYVSQPSVDADKVTIEESTIRRANADRPASATPREEMTKSSGAGLVEAEAGRESKSLVFSWKFGVAVLAAFAATFIPVMVLRGTLHNPPRGFSLFANLYLAGTIIFGGGPVVIPLLREYVVFEGWVSPRDFLLGLAIVQAFPGPNFNFAVYLGALAVQGSGLNAAVGALIGYLAIFTPGLALHTGAMGLWKVMRRHRWVVSGLRGINATAVGLIYAAVYRLWEIGYISQDFQGGTSLGRDPWWLVTAATSFVGGMWFGVEAPIAILLGGAMGMIWYGIVAA